MFLANSLNRDCSNMNLGDSIGCGINKDGGKVMGVGPIAVGALGLIVTAVSDAPDKP